jgi:hypothetical protein
VTSHCHQLDKSGSFLENLSRFLGYVRAFPVLPRGLGLPLAKNAKLSKIFTIGLIIQIRNGLLLWRRAVDFNFKLFLFQFMDFTTFSSRKFSIPNRNQNQKVNKKLAAIIFG